MKEHFLAYVENSINQYWDYEALTDYKGKTFTYGEIAVEIARLHLIFEKAGIKKGDKIALCSRNMSRWGIAFLAISSYEAVAVPLLHDFSPENIHHLVNHSDATLLFIGEDQWPLLKAEEMPQLTGVIAMNKTSLLVCRSEALQQAFDTVDTLYKEKYPQGLKAGDLHFPTDNFDNLAIINYTSGTTSNSKGVMLSYRCLSSNIQFAKKRMYNEPGFHLVSMLPMAHMYGLAFEFLFQMSSACHVFFLNRAPSPQILLNAFATANPYLIITVPLVIEKIFKKTVFPIIHKPVMKAMLKVPGLSRLIKNKIRDKLLQALGGHLVELVVGGSAINQEVEDCMKDIRLPYSIGFGMTECGPLICYENYWNFVKSSCGKIVDRMQMRIDSKDPQNIVGEIQVKGDCVMMGYYKRPEITAAVTTEDGWMRTGDLGIIDKEGNLFIKGRCKNLILGANGQNIFPEEIEDKLNNMPYIIESIVIEREKKIVALVYPDYDRISREALGEDGIVEVMEKNRVALNRSLPAYSRINKIEIFKHEFEKTPKKSIKRFLYK